MKLFYRVKKKVVSFNVFVIEYIISKNTNLSQFQQINTYNVFEKTVKHVGIASVIKEL